MHLPKSFQVLIIFIVAALHAACASNFSNSNSNSNFESSGGAPVVGYNDNFLNKAPAQFSPPADVNKILPTDPIYQRTQADYYFSLGESLSLEGQHQKAIEAFKLTLVYDPNSAMVSMRMAAEYVKLGLISEALDSAELAIKKNPKSVDAHLLLGGLYSSLKMYEKANGEYHSVLKLDPHNVDAPLYMGAILAELKEYDKSAKQFEKLLATKDYANKYLVHYYIGRVYSEKSMQEGITKSQRKNIQKVAEQSFLKSLQEKPDFADSVVGLANIYIKQGDIKKGIATYQKFQVQQGPNVKISEHLMQYFIEIGDLDNAYEQMEILEPVSDDAINIKMKMSLILIEKKIYDKAEEKLQQILMEVPDSDKIRFYLGAIYEETQKYPLAVEQFKKIPSSSQYYGEAILHASYLQRVLKKPEEALVTIEEGLKVKKDMPQLFVLQGTLYQEKGQIQKAAKIIESASEKFPDNLQIMFYLGRLKDQVGEKDAMFILMKKIIELEPSHSQALNYLAFSYAEIGTHLDEAEKYARRALEEDPKDGFVLDTLGWVLFKAKKYPEAVKYLEAALKAQPHESLIADHLGDAYFEYHLVMKAKQTYEKAIALEVDNKKINQIKEKLNLIDNQNLNLTPDSMSRKPASIPGKK